MRTSRIAAAGLLAVGLSALVPVTAGAQPVQTDTGSQSVVINEIAYGDNLNPGMEDSVELYNAGTETVDLAGWSLHDEKDRPGEGDLTGTIAPGEYLVLVNKTDFDFGLGKGDSVRLFNATELVDSYTYVVTATENWSRCPDGTGDFAPGTELTLGAPNNCTPVTEPAPEPGPEPAPEPAPAAAQLVLNEIDSSPSDWVEFYNPGAEPLDISGYEIRDNSDDHRWQFPAGSTIEAGSYLVVEATTVGLAYNDQTGLFEQDVSAAPIGIGSGDSIRVYNAAGDLLDETSWTAHAAIDGSEAAATISRCPDATGSFQIGFATKGAPNECPQPSVVVNEIETNGDVTDWVEIMNTGDTPVDISGWYMYDDGGASRAGDVTPVAQGTVLAPGEFFVFDQNIHFTFGLGKDDQVNVYDAAGQLIAQEATTPEHANGSMSRCPDGTGEFIDVAVSSKGAANSCGNPVVLNEIESSDPADGPDWIELANPLGEPLDISGLVIRDNKDDSEYVIPAGTSIPANDYLVIDDLGFGLGGGDSVRIYDGVLLVEDYSWTEHAAQTYGRCPDVTGAFADTREATPGARNACTGIPDIVAYPSVGEPTVVDTAAMFLEDSSGLDYADGVLWAVDNGTGTFWKLVPQADGSVEFADGWEAGKRARFIKDADNPAAAGPDSEGITIAGDGNLYLAVERDNSDKAVNFNALLQIDPNAAGPDVVASAQWDLTDLLPAVAANTGIESVEWISNGDAAGMLWDDNTGAAYDPVNYPNAVSGGVFVTALEDNGHVYAFSLNSDGSAILLSSYDALIGGAMGLDYMPGTDRLRVLSDDGYNGVLADIYFDGTNSPEVLHYERPAGMPNVNNEGYAESHVCSDDVRIAWFFTDGVMPGSLRSVPLACDSVPTPDDGATTPGGAGTDPEPGDATATPDGNATDVAAGGAASGSDSSGTGSGSGELSYTGASVAGIAALAVLLVAAGAVLSVRRQQA